MSIKIKNLTKIYKQQKAISSLNFEVEKGEILGFLGPNGAGKSTTMKIATTLLLPTEGTIEIQGYDVITQKQLVKTNIGYLSEQNPLYTDMFVKEHLFLIGRLHTMTNPLLQKRVDEMIELCSLSSEKHKLVSQLSKGYKQRLGLAQALIHNPPVLILDEPTTGLDPNQITEIRNLIKDVSHNKTVLFSTHIMQEVKALCQRVVIIHKGEKVADENVSFLEKNIFQTHSIQIEFAHNPNSLDTIHSFTEITNIQQQSENIYILTATHDIRAELLKHLTQNNISVSGIHLIENSLEDIFKHLTH